MGRFQQLGSYGDNYPHCLGQSCVAPVFVRKMKTNSQNERETLAKSKGDFLMPGITSAKLIVI